MALIREETIPAAMLPATALQAGTPLEAMLPAAILPVIPLEATLPAAIGIM